MSSLKERIFSVAFDCFNPVFTASSLDDRLFSRWATSTWANIKNQGIYCWTLAYSCIQRVARAFERFVHPELVPEERQPQRSAALSADANALVDQGNFRGDRRSVFEAVRVNGNALQYASCWLKWDRELVLTALRQNGNALQYASFWLRSDREVVFAAVHQNGNALQYADHYFCSGNRDVVFAAVLQNGNALRYANRRLRGDKECVLQAIGQTHEAFQYANTDLQRDLEVIGARNGHLQVARNDNLQ
ncbi:MAG: DUF4116 domain-containing protein [Chlamydiia bacterium]|nr:DUF4116 domain-containing protein [Chlamydiia bacterium]